MKNLLTLVFVAILGIAAAQNNFEKGMLQAFELWNANKIENALNLFERIGNAEENEWLPHYYIAQINIQTKFQITMRQNSLTDK